MSQRVMITSNGGSPFRVSVPGVDASGAQFNDLLFDANQQPLLVYATGYFRANVVPYGSIEPFESTAGDGVNSTPSGTYPHFLIAIRQPTNGSGSFAPGSMRTPKVQATGPSSWACGGVIGDDRIMYAFNCAQRGSNGNPYPDDNYRAYFNYCLFLNHG